MPLCKSSIRVSSTDNEEELSAVGNNLKKDSNEARCCESRRPKATMAVMTFLCNSSNQYIGRYLR